MWDFLNRRISHAGESDASPVKSVPQRFWLLEEPPNSKHADYSRSWKYSLFSMSGECYKRILSGASLTESTWYCGQYWPIVPAPDDRWWWLWSNWWSEDWQRKPKYSEKMCPKFHFVHHKSHKTWPGLEPRPPRCEASTNLLRCYKRNADFIQKSHLEWSPIQVLISQNIAYLSFCGSSGVESSLEITVKA
jgi:hypothetical protein